MATSAAPTGAIGRILYDIFKVNRRKELDTNYHYVPVDLNTIKLTLVNAFKTEAEVGPEIFAVHTIETFMQELMQELEVGAKNAFKYSIKPLSTGSFEVNGKFVGTIDHIDTLSQYLPAVVRDGNNNIIGALFNSFDSAGRQFFTPILNKKLTRFLSDTVSKIDEKTTIDTIDITNREERKDVYREYHRGHIVGTGSTQTPLQIKFQQVLNEINIQLQNQSNHSGLLNLQTKVKGALATLTNKSSYGTTIQANLAKDFSDTNNFLMRIKANIVVIQDGYENTRLYADLVEHPLWKEIEQELLNTHFSRTFKEELAHRVVTTLSKGLGSISPTKSKKVLPAIVLNVEKATNKVSNSTNKYSKVSVKPPKGYKPTPSYSLVSLQSLINNELSKIIAKNMGTGNSKNLLNYRTGRLAESAKVERMSQSREGMITAFYSYMKNPYATFSTGGAQSNPASRDPKLLISKSIREIAATQVANRMRAVSV